MLENEDDNMKTRSPAALSSRLDHLIYKLEHDEQEAGVW